MSDIHLGNEECRHEELNSFLSGIETDHLYLVGDIVDVWRMDCGSCMFHRHRSVIDRISQMAKSGTNVVYIRGNHDDRIEDRIPECFVGVASVKESEHVLLDGRRVLMTHGDTFDMGFVKRHASLAYRSLVFINRFYNAVRSYLGREERVITGALKQRAKWIAGLISAFENQARQYAKSKGYSGVICGHVHHAEIKDGDVLYANCGDWVESCTAIVEHHNGCLELLRVRG